MGGRGINVATSEGMTGYGECREEELDYDKPHEMFMHWKGRMRNGIR